MAKANSFFIKFRIATHAAEPQINDKPKLFKTNTQTRHKHKIEYKQSKKIHRRWEQVVSQHQP